MPDAVFVITFSDVVGIVFAVLCAIAIAAAAILDWRADRRRNKK